MIGSAARAYREARELDKWVGACRLRLQHAHNRNSADAARLRLAQALEAQANYQEAIEHVQAMHNVDKLPMMQKMIARLRRKLAAKKNLHKNPPGGTSDTSGQGRQ